MNRNFFFFFLLRVRESGFPTSKIVIVVGSLFIADATTQLFTVNEITVVRSLSRYTKRLSTYREGKRIFARVQIRKKVYTLVKQ